MLRRDGTGLGDVQRVRDIETVTEALQLAHEALKVPQEVVQMAYEGVVLSTSETIPS